MTCWCGYLSGARCRLFVNGPAGATASQNPTVSSSCKSKLALPFWYQLTKIVMEKRLLNWCSNSSVLLLSAVVELVWFCMIKLEIRPGSKSSGFGEEFFNLQDTTLVKLFMRVCVSVAKQYNFVLVTGM